MPVPQAKPETMPRVTPATQANPSGAPATVVAVVVAYNRRDLLAQTLAALTAQTRPVDDIVIIDNGSTDGTSTMVRRDFGAAALTVLPRNTGGAGGFAVGIERAMLAHDADWVWLMDDDTVPEPYALAALLGPTEELDAPDLVASRVVWRDGRDHPMNTPRTRPFADQAMVRTAARYAAYPVRSASFVSVMIKASAIRRAGLPVADYFLWNDDFEFTSRLLRNGRGYLIRTSIVRHLTKTFGSTDRDPGPRFYLEVRNKVWMMTRSSALAPAERALYGGSTLRRWWRTFVRSSDRRVLGAGLLRGLRDGLRGPRPNDQVLVDLAGELVSGQRILAGDRR